MKDTLVGESELLGNVAVTATNAAVLSSKLQQLSAGILFPDDAQITGAPAHRLHWEKVNAVKEIVEGTGSPVLVLYQFIEERQMLLRSEEHTSELQSRGHLVCRLLLEKKNQSNNDIYTIVQDTKAREGDVEVHKVSVVMAEVDKHTHCRQEIRLNCVDRS